MTLSDGLREVRAFSPTGNETADVRRLYELLDALGDLQRDPQVRRELIGIFERHPGADLGSPGPIVHALERSWPSDGHDEHDEHVELVATSIRRRATGMTLWMAERCLRAKLSEGSRALLLKALAEAREREEPGELRQDIADALREYGGGSNAAD